MCEWPSLLLSALYLTNKLSYIFSWIYAAGIYVVSIGNICFWFWTNYSLRVYMSFQSDTFVSDSEPTTLCGYICRSNRTHLFLILNHLLFAGIYVVPIGHICFWFWINYSLLLPLIDVCHRIVWLFVWPDRGLIPRSTVIMFTTAPPTRLAKHEMWYFFSITSIWYDSNAHFVVVLMVIRT